MSIFTVLVRRIKTVQGHSLVPTPSQSSFSGGNQIREDMGLYRDMDHFFQAAGPDNHYD